MSRPGSPEGGVAPGSGAMFDRIAGRYDRLNRVLSLGLDRGWRRRAIRALGLHPGARVLDLATGTGEVAMGLVRAHPGVAVVGLDPSAAMLSQARGKRARAIRLDRHREGGLTLVRGDAAALPFGPACFDAAVMAFGIRNVPDRQRVLAELGRVVRPGGPVVILELSDPEGPLVGRLGRWHVHRVVPWLGGVLSGVREYRHLERSIAAFPRPEVFAGWMSDSGLSEVSVSRLGLGAACLFVGRASGGRR